jgi:hypothetical protein
MSGNKRIQAITIRLIKSLLKKENSYDTYLELINAGYTQDEIDLAVQMATTAIR